MGINLIFSSKKDMEDFCMELKSKGVDYNHEVHEEGDLIFAKFDFLNDKVIGVVELETEHKAD